MKFILQMGHHIPRKPTTINLSAHYRASHLKKQARHHNTASSPSSSSSPKPADSGAKPKSPSSSSSPARDQPCNKPAKSEEAPAETSPPRPPSASPASTGAPVPPAVPPSNTVSVSRSRTLRQIIQTSAIGRAGAFYSRVQSRRPYLTQLVCTLFIYLCGDLSAQVLVPSLTAGAEEENDNRLCGKEEEGNGERAGKVEYDPLRTLRHLTVGAIACVPSYEWFMFLHRNFNYASKPLSILLKVLISQIVYTPLFNTYFFSLQSLLAGNPLSETVELVQKAVPTSIVNSLKLWPAVTAFMFVYVDPQFRNIFAGGIAVGWQTYLSWLNQKAAREIRIAEMVAAREDMSTRGGAAATALLQR